MIAERVRVDRFYLVMLPLKPRRQLEKCRKDVGDEWALRHIRSVVI